MKPRQLIPALIIAAGIWAYHNSFQGPFIFDDLPCIPENPYIRHLWPIWDALSPSANSFVGGRPVVNLSLALNYASGGLAVWGYHALNLAIHILAALTLYGIARRTLLRPGLRERFGPSADWLALAVALIWTVHPLQTEAVTYISQRCESLMGLFYLLTLYCFIRGAESPGHGQWFVLSVVACALGMGSKEVMVTAPVMVLLYDRTFVSGSFREAWTRRWRLYLGLASSWLWLGYLMAGVHNRDVGYGLGITSWGYGLTECRAVVQYLRLAVWPHPLIFDYGQYVPTGPLAAVAPYALILMVLAAGVLFALKRQPAIGFVGAWFFVILAPTSSVVPIAGQPMAEHRMYLPLAAVVTLVVLGAMALAKRLRSQPQGVIVGCVAVVVVLLAFLTIQRNQDYQSTLGIWQDTVEKCPNNPRAHSNLATALLQTGNMQEATEHWEQALRIRPDFAEVHNTWGLALMSQGRLQEAIGHYEQALRIKPDNATAHYNLGLASARLGRLQEAIGHYEDALRLKPDYAEAHNNLGLALKAQGRLPEAIDHYEQALRLEPNSPEVHSNLGVALAQLGRMPEAMEQWELALRIKPDHAGAHNNLGVALMRQNKLQEAIDHFQQALQIKPDYADAHNNLELALEKAGRAPEAISQYEQMLRIKPDSIEAQNNLAWLLATLAPEDGGNPVRGLALAQRVCELTGNRAAPYLDTLAAAYAANGQFSNAIATAGKAIDLARANGQPQVAAQIEPRLELYRSGRAYRQFVAMTTTNKP